MTVACIVQARMNSSRFPGKVLANLAGKPVLQHVLERCKEIRGVDKIVCAVPGREGIEAIATLEQVIRPSGALFFSRGGPEDDVLTRYQAAAEAYEADVIMRITADCPLLDPDVCSDVLAKFNEPQHKGWGKDSPPGNYDYVSNVCPRTWPKGYDCEVFSREALEWASLYAENNYDREHVTPFLQRTKWVRRFNVEASFNASHVNYCVDYPDDIARLEGVLKEAA